MVIRHWYIYYNIHTIIILFQLRNLLFNLQVEIYGGSQSSSVLYFSSLLLLLYSVFAIETEEEFTYVSMVQSDSYHLPK